jgi:hypothetical protein
MGPVSGDCAHLCLCAATHARRAAFIHAPRARCAILEPTWQYCAPTHANVRVCNPAAGFLEPLRLSFPEMFEADSAEWQAIEHATIVFLSIDMLLNCMTGYLKDGTKLVREQPAVLIQYLRSWFFFDLISTLPFHELVSMDESENNNSVLRLSKFFRLLKLFKLLRLVRSSKVLLQVLQHTQLNPSLVRLLNLVALLFLSWHIIACIWWFLRVQVNPLHPHMVHARTASLFAPCPSDVCKFAFWRAGREQHYLRAQLHPASRLRS